MDDTISRQVAIDALCAVCGKACDKSEFVYNAPQDEQVILCPEHYCLCTLPAAQPEQRWIPCAERLPERGVSVLISHVGFVSEDYLDTDDGALFFWNSGLDLDEERQNIAWMPLPSAWKGDNNA